MALVNCYDTISSPLHPRDCALRVEMHTHGKMANETKKYSPGLQGPSPLSIMLSCPWLAVLSILLIQNPILIILLTCFSQSHSPTEASALDPCIIYYIEISVYLLNLSPSITHSLTWRINYNLSFLDLIFSSLTGQGSFRHVQDQPLC